jgi:SOS regulatory protein LexA
MFDILLNMRKVIQRDYKKLSESIYHFYDKNYRMPSFQELTNIFAVNSKDTVARIVEDLVNLEFIDKDKNGKLLPIFDKFKSHNYKPKKTLTQKIFKLKMLGLVEAGFPTFVEASDMETITLDDWLVGDKTATFMLRVKGESMIDAGIMDGDYVIVERGREPKSGDIVLANVDSGWTLKYFKKEKNKIVLIPANKNFKPIYPKENLEIPAVVVSVVRKYKN